jgi:type I restriction enzyme S subunit
LSSTCLAELCVKIGSGATPRGGNKVYEKTGISLIRSQNVYNDGFNVDGLAYINEIQAKELDNVTVESNDVLLNITGDSVARCCLVPSSVLPARVNQHVMIIRPNPNLLDARFLKYFLSSKQIQSHLLSVASSGGTRNALTKDMIKYIRIPIFDLLEQKKTAAMLGSLDDKIELNTHICKSP